ncbi:MAG: hypothetical protein PF501_02980 [Salinisphaera sp.]|jgi:hypothetical protein|nr:hypothetical protein [Salinisphaera sp.]
MAFETDRQSQDRDTPQRSWPSAIPKWVGIGIFLYLTVFALGYAQVFFIPIIFAYLLSLIDGL